MEKRILELGNEKLEIKVNYRTSYRLTKFRNRLSNNKAILAADRDVIEEIRKITESGKEITGEVVLDLSPKAREYFIEATKKDEELFSMEEQFEIVKILTGIEDENKIEKLFDTEVIMNGYDSLSEKLIAAVSMVFMNAKDGLQVVE